MVFPVFILLFLVLLVLYGMLIEKFRKAWHHIPDYKVNGSATPDVAIIIALRNESENIEPLIAALQAQDYPAAHTRFILVDDFSEDDTAARIRKLLLPNMQLICMKDLYPEEGVLRSHKKRAIEAGIAASSSALIITTDADCRFGPQWISSLVRCQVATTASFIAAPVRFAPVLNFLDRFQTLDFLSLQGITGAAVSSGYFSMCNGANLLYTRAAFEKVNGFEGIDQLPSGDDMFLMQKVARAFPGTTFYCKDHEAIVTTAPVKGLGTFFQQRIRWASKADSYEEKRLFRTLLLVYAINLCYFILAIWILFLPTQAFLLLLLLTAKLLIEFPFVNAVSLFFRQQQLMPWFPLMQPFHIIYTLIAGWLGKFGSYRWKGRTIKKAN